jgi:hypothetical protein
MTKRECQMTDDKKLWHEPFVISASSLIRHSPATPTFGEGESFGIRHF